MDSNSLEKKRSDDQPEEEHAHSKADIVDNESRQWDSAFSKQTLRKVDTRVLPILAVVYALSL
jgi:hypothetical protein